MPDRKFYERVPPNRKLCRQRRESVEVDEEVGNILHGRLNPSQKMATDLIRVQISSASHSKLVTHEKVCIKQAVPLSSRAKYCCKAVTIL